MDRMRDRGGLGPVPAWLEIQGLSVESLRAAVTGLGIEILGALCARAEPAPVRVRLCSLSARKFTYTMYFELCRYIESCRAGRGSERTIVPGRGKHGEETGLSAGIQRIKVEVQVPVGPQEAVRDSEDGEQKKLLKKIPCISCSHSITTRAALKMNMKRHPPVSNDKKFKCSDCPYSTCYKSKFVTHTRIHTREKPYTCSVCGKGFGHSSNCQKHIRIHTGERPYTCAVCGKGFAQSSSCQIHLRVHTGERPYTCSVCAKTFSYSSTLKNHTRIHTGERPYTCKFCAKTFSYSSALKNHTRIHTGERPYTCKVCEKTFSDRSSCNSHTGIHRESKSMT